jgi:predicted cupin superfamily sugar epimerase
VSAADPETFIEHPEGGRFLEVYRSGQTVMREGQPDRCACTHIYFHLASGEVSKFHRVNQEEIWNLYRGTLRLWIYDENSDTLEEHLLSAERNSFCAVVPAGHWQAAEPVHGDVRVGCTVAPGFDFADFTLIDQNSPLATKLAGKQVERLV